MRVAFDYLIFSMQQYGGISRYFHELGAHLSSFEDVELSWPVFAHGNSYLRESSNGHYVSIAPDTRIKRGVRKLANATMTKAWLAAHPQDIIHETFYRTTPWPGRHRTVVTVHDMIVEKHPEENPNAVADAAIKRAAVMRADHVICISENTKKDLLELVDVAPSHISVIPHGWRRFPEAAATNLPANIVKPFLLYVGARSTYKNWKNFIAAYAQSSLPADFQIVCFGGGEFTPEEMATLAKYKLTEIQVTQAGGGDAILGTLYQNAALFVYPSLYEGFGMPLLEAMAAGCPVACGDVSSLPEVAGAAAEYFDPMSSESIAAAIQRVVSSKAHAEELVRQGEQRLPMFSWERCAEQTRDVYRKLAG
ncbi:mannosyltransferase [Capsulimonas corticalis]|uniref:Mannosyltransferase n=1 Tax=Capsulimonas corticalis TaxID=2219043 RepID=A0A402CUA0_9BACT|nr:glycosyltransferase family 1 protein [Capsulimonas corticalis]BDI28891.1 mannosyltransferase [Capsulimonas corticalis]